MPREGEESVSRLEYPEEIRALIGQFKRLPGVGPRSAERIALWLLRSRLEVAGELASALSAAAAGVRLCGDCGFFAGSGTGCRICGDAGRDRRQICVVEQSTDILPLERTGAFHGLYHALHGRISPLDNVGPEDIRIGSLMERLATAGVEEVILATGSDVEGEATAHYLGDQIRRSHPGIVVSRLAQGLPAGGGLESADELTLMRALSGRRTVGEFRGP